MHRIHRTVDGADRRYTAYTVYSARTAHTVRTVYRCTQPVLHHGQSAILHPLFRASPRDLLCFEVPLIKLDDNSLRNRHLRDLTRMPLRALVRMGRNGAPE